MKDISTSKFIIVESQILLDKNLNNTDKILYSYISALTNNQSNYCYANNKYLSELINSSPRQIQRGLKKLEKLDYIIIKYNKNKRQIKTTLSKFLEVREQLNNKIDLFDYNWLDESDK